MHSRLSTEEPLLKLPLFPQVFLLLLLSTLLK